MITAIKQFWTMDSWPRNTRRLAIPAVLVLAVVPSVATAIDPAVTSPQLDASLRLWLDASYTQGILDENAVDANNDSFTGNVATWQDRSGNGNDATQGTIANQPTYQSGVVNLQNGVRFDATDDGMTTGLTLSSAPYTVFALYNWDNTAPAFRRAVQGSNNWLIGPYNGHASHYAGTDFVSAGVSPAIQNQFYLATALNSGAASTFLVDGANRTTNSAPTGSPGTISLGAAGAFAEPLDGEMVEVLAYDKVLSQSELSQVGLYFNNKYGLKNGLGNVATGAAVIKDAGSFSPAFAASRVTDGRTTDTFAETYWLGQNEVATGSFTLDLGSSKNVQNIALLNTHNTNSNDRGTRQFEIWASDTVDGNNDLVNPVKILAGKLSTTLASINNDDNQPLDVFNADTGLSPGSYRYLRFDALDRSFEWNVGNRSVGLNEIFVFEDKRLSNVTAGKPVVASSTYPLPSEFQAGNIVDQRYDDLRNLAGDVFDNVPAYGTQASYWLAPDGVTDATLTVDLQGEFRIDRIDLQNTHNGQFNERGTADFRIEASTDGVLFSTIFSGTLADVTNLGSEIPIITYSAAAGDFSPFFATQLRFVAETFYHTGAGLNELVGYGVLVPEPSSLGMLAFGMISLWLFRRKKA
jgi:hypothetical protein